MERRYFYTADGELLTIATQNDRKAMGEWWKTIDRWRARKSLAYRKNPDPKCRFFC